MDRKLKQAGALFFTGFFKKVLMMMFVLDVCIGNMTAVYGNNVRISGEPDVQLNATSDSLSLTFTLSWDNSWRDNFNWDAVWLFVKYKKEGSTDAWSHLYLGGEQTGTSVLEIDPGNTGNQVVGAFVYPKNKGAFNIAGERVTLKASLNGLSASDISDKKVYFAVSAIEMVLIPYGAYYLGDGVSNLCFHEAYVAERNPIRLNGYKSLDASSIHSNHNASLPVNAIDNNMGTHYHSAGIEDEWFMIDFGMRKEMRYFTISTHYGGTGYFLEGSNDKSTWSVLWSGNGSAWSQTLSKYRITNPGAYQYYRFRETGNYLVIYDVALWENDAPSVWVDSESLLYYRVSRNSLTENLQIPATYPKGYKGFYIMKYELSQEQYCNFLNMLSYTQQKSRIGNNLDNLNRGDYVFGNPKKPSCRNGIAVFSRKNTSQPAVFGCNLNPAEPFFDKDDGQTLACNYMTGADMLAYLDWSGLRPMSELEYEKACRTPNRVMPGEYAWNTTSVTSLGGQGGLTGSTLGTENESPANMNTNANSGTPSFGPVRCGSFGTSNTNQEQSGGSFYGVMELSGNLGEICYSVTGGSSLNTSSSNNEYHGDGTLAANGDFNVSTYWNRSNDATAFSIRGGSFASPDSLLRISDRSIIMAYNNTLRDSSVTFRGVRSVEETVIPGEIKMVSDTVCPGSIDILNKDKAKCSTDFKYQWYVKRPGESDYEIIKNEEGESLNNYEVVNFMDSPQIYCFKRKVLSLTGEAFSNIVCLTVAIVPVDVPSVPLSYNSIVGTQFNLPCIVEGQNKSEWKTPAGDIMDCDLATVTISAFSKVYQVYFKNEYGCKGRAQDVSVIGYQGITSIPAHAKVYQGLGAMLDGVYMLDPDGIGGNEPLPVYCNMTNDGGGWMLIVNSVSGTPVSSFYTIGEYNGLYVGNIYESYKYADAWINLFAYDMYWTEGKNSCNKISNSYWKASECNGGGVFSAVSSCGDSPTSYCCYRRYDDPAMKTGFHEGVPNYRRNMFDDDRGNDAYLIWPYHCGVVYIDHGRTCTNGGAGSGEYRIWIR